MLRARRGHSIVFPIVVWVGAAVCVAGVAAAFRLHGHGRAQHGSAGTRVCISTSHGTATTWSHATTPPSGAVTPAGSPRTRGRYGRCTSLDFPLQGTAAVISWLFAGATIVLLWATFFERRVDRAAAGALVYAAFAPGQIYHYAIFPLSLLAFCSVAFMWLLYRGRVVAAGIAGAVATLAYPTGVVLAPVAALWLLLQRQLLLGERLRRIAIVCGLIVVGVWILLLDLPARNGSLERVLPRPGRLRT